MLSVSSEGYNQWSEVFQTCYDYFLVIKLVILLTQNRIIKHCRGLCGRFCLALVLHCDGVYSGSVVVEYNSKKHIFRCPSVILFFPFVNTFFFLSKSQELVNLKEETYQEWVNLLTFSQYSASWLYSPKGKWGVKWKQ